MSVPGTKAGVKTLREKAEEMARYHNRKVEPWMLWTGWEVWIGCSNCQEGGPLAGCWGKAGCHGFWEGCGCYLCAQTERELALRG